MSQYRSTVVFAYWLKSHFSVLKNGEEDDEDKEKSNKIVPRKSYK